MVYELQVYFLSTITQSGMLLTSPSVEVAGRHRVEKEANDLEPEERMDELFVETSDVEIYVAPGDVEMRRDPWIGQGSESPNKNSVFNSSITFFGIQDFQICEENHQ